MRLRAQRLAQPGILDAADRLTFERHLQKIRLTFLVSPVLVVAAFGGPAIPFALAILAATLGSYGLVWALLRHAPAVLLRWQLGLRLLDACLVALVLDRYHAFLGDTYYDTAYLPFVVAAAATHGRLGTTAIGVAAGALVFLSRWNLMTQGVLEPAVRHVTDSVFFAVLFLATGAAVAFLMRLSGEVVARREKAWVEEVARQNRELERLAAENAALFEKAEQGLQLARESLATASHDLKNPLVVIRSYAQVLQREAQRSGGDSGVWRSDRLARIDAAARQVQALADELSDVARLELGEGISLDLELTDLVELAEDQVALAQGTTSKHSVHLATDEPGIVGRWDAARMERVIANLLQNAVKYSPKGGQVVVRVRRDGADHVLLEVHDHGVGIPASDLPHVFERYRRGRNVEGRIGGSGLGLAGARAIVELHGGTISAESEEGTGTVMRVRLPVMAENEPPAKSG